MSFPSDTVWVFTLISFFIYYSGNFYKHSTLPLFSAFSSLPSWLIIALQVHSVGGRYVGGRGVGVRTRFRRVPRSVLFEMRWLGGFSTQPLDAFLPHSVKDELPWQSNSLIVLWCQKRNREGGGETGMSRGEDHWVAAQWSIQTIQRLCSISEVYEETNSSSLCVLVLTSLLHIFLQSQNEQIDDV